MEQRFLENMADILEVDASELSLDTDFREPRFDWDSLKGYAVLVMIEEEFGKELELDQFIEAGTIGDLLRHVN
jgi:acyl carrier protein